MKRILIIIMLGLASASARADALTDSVPAKRFLKSQWGHHFCLLRLFDISPVLETGFSYSRYYSGNYYWTFDFRLAIAKLKTEPADYYDHSLFNFYLMPQEDVMVTWAYRIGRKTQWRGLKFISEVGPAYSRFYKAFYTPTFTFSFSPYVFEHRLFHLPSLSIRNGLVFSETRLIRSELFVHVLVNPKFSYTSVGIQLGLRRHKASVKKFIDGE